MNLDEQNLLILKIVCSFWIYFDLIERDSVDPAIFSAAMDGAI